METHQFNSLFVTMNTLTREGYTEDFKAGEVKIKALYSKHEYQPKDLLIIESYHFDKITNPENDMQLFAIKANDGIKGSLVMSYGAKHLQNMDLIKQIKERSD